MSTPIVYCGKDCDGTGCLGHDARTFPTPYVSRRAQIAREIADRLIADLSDTGAGGCVCDDQTGAARARIIQAIEDAMTREAETT